MTSRERSLAAFGDDAQLRSLPGGEAERRVLCKQFVCWIPGGVQYTVAGLPLGHKTKGEFHEQT